MTSGLRFFDKEPSSWEELEDLVAQAFREMRYHVIQRETVKTVRGKVEVDILATNKNTAIPSTVLIECKYWNKPVPQQVVHGFRAVCDDIGVNFGLIISKTGFQSGAAETSTSTNIQLFDFGKFQELFFSEWKVGAFMLLTAMYDQLLPLQRALMSKVVGGNGSNLKLPEGLRWPGKYDILLGVDGRFTDFFIGNRTFPAEISDPRGDPSVQERITVSSHREYLDVAIKGAVDASIFFNLPMTYVCETGPTTTFYELVSRVN
jgi:Restriction endonuclease